MIPLCSPYSASAAFIPGDACSTPAERPPAASFSATMPLLPPRSANAALPLVSLHPAHGAPAAAAASAAATAAPVLFKPTVLPEAEECCFCLEPMDSTSDKHGGVFTLSCNHTMHLLCLSKGLEHRKVCPMDQSQISSSDRARIHKTMNVALQGALNRNQDYEQRIEHLEQNFNQVMQRVVVLERPNCVMEFLHAVTCNWFK